MIVVVVLGFGIVSFVGFSLLNLYPFTYAVPEETFAVKTVDESPASKLSLNGLTI